MAQATPPQLSCARSLLVLGTLLTISTLACGSRTAVLLGDPAADANPEQAGGDTGLPHITCAPPAKQCVTRDATDPCARARLVPATCDSSTLTWTCPVGAWPYARAAELAGDCLPLYDASGPSGPSGPFRSVQGSLSRVPTDDGRCLWVAESVQLASGQSLRNVAFELDPHTAFGTCPRSVAFSGGSARDSVVFSDGGADPTLLVQITGGYRIGGKTRVTYRLFRLDAGAVFGLAELGTGLGYWDATSQRIVVFGAERPRFETDLDFGNASWVEGNYAYLWGCNAPGHFLTEGCLLARLDAKDGLELFTGNNQWSANAEASAGAIVFDDGPWISSVTRDFADSTQLLHVFAGGFGDELRMQRATQAQGPWTQAAALAPCSLPAGDSKAYCAGPIVHEELADPMRPSELVVSYGRGTTGPAIDGRPEAYWSRIAWIARK